jgi:hypothetical protein
LQRLKADFPRRPANRQVLCLAWLNRLGKAVSPAGSRWADPMTVEQNAVKYELCKKEWKRRHPKLKEADEI